MSDIAMTMPHVMPNVTPELAHFVLRLYVTGMTKRSARAISNARAICEQHLEGRYDLQVIDVYQQPARREDRIVVLPTLIKQLPLPAGRIIGDLADADRTLLALNLKLPDAPGPR